MKKNSNVATYFKDQKVALVKEESGFFYKNYDIVFVSGEKVEFDKSGDWPEIQCKQSEVPAQAIPKAIRNYVKMNRQDAKIVEIEKDSHGYEIKLSNRFEIKFNTKLQVVDIDD